MKTYLIITTTIQNRVGIIYPDRRKQEYFLAIANVLYLLPKNIIPIIVENSMENNESYLDVFNCPIIYTKNNHFETMGDYQMHKGAPELNAIKDVIRLYNIQPEDMIIKMTGRYLLFKPDFFNLVLDNPDKDAFLRYFNVCSHTSNKNDMVLGLFALRAKYFKIFEYRNAELGAEEDMVSNINEFIPKDKICETDKLWLRVFLGDSGKIVDV